MARNWLASITFFAILLNLFIPTAGSALAAPRAADPPGWYALSNVGLNAEVHALAEYQGSLYVGGMFTQTSDGAVTDLNYIARYDGNAWNALPNKGLKHGLLLSDVHTMVVYNGSLYVGGTFTQTFDGAVVLNNIARFDGTTWHALPNNGLNDSVYTLAVYGGDLYVGGGFDQTTDGALLNLGNIVRYDGAAWQALPHQGLGCLGAICPGGFAPDVAALQAYGSDLYVGGRFDRAGDGGVINLNNITRYDGAAWHALTNNGLDGPVSGFGIYGGNLYVGGNYIKTADTTKNLFFLSRYDGSAWYALPNESVDAAASSIVVVGSNLYTGGSFTDTADGLVDDLNQIARFDGTSWHALPNKGLAGANRTVDAMALFNGDLYVGGEFTRTFESITLNFIGRLVLPTVPETPEKTPIDPDNLPSKLPSTGFAPGVRTDVGFQPSRKAYTDLGQLWLEIPRLNVKLPIVGVPYEEKAWDVSWLASQAGYLEGTAFPTLAGNSVITGHVYDRSGLPGPFVKLDTLAYDDQVIIHAWGQAYTYQVRSNELVSPTDKSILKHETYPWVTLLTCQGYNPRTDSYHMRRLVRAVLVQVKP